MRGLFASSVNLRPDPAQGELLVKIHGQATPIHDATLDSICRRELVWENGRRLLGLKPLLQPDVMSIL